MELLFANGGLHALETFSSVKRFLIERGQCDVILAESSYATFGTLRALIDLRIAVPDQISLIGLSMSAFMPYLSPKPTVITGGRHQFAAAISKMALILSNPNAKPIPNILVPTHLIAGETTGHRQSQASSSASLLSEKFQEQPFQ